jgi:predicted GNAT family N-acyltransferase
MAVDAAWRRKGVGSALLARLVQMSRDRGDAAAILNAQTYVTAFYRRAGFMETSGEFMDAGIAHVEMRFRLREG